jgi:hypothetical protein
MNAIANLSVAEADELAEHEAVIECGLKTFIDVGLRLATVRDERLYRGGYATFEEYCEGRWNFSDRRARQLIDAAGMVAALPTGTIVPVTESQARELVGLSPDDAAEVMRLARAETGGKITAKAITAARERVSERCYPYREHKYIACLPWDQSVVDAIAEHLDRDRDQLLRDIADPDQPPQSLSGFLRIAYPIVLSSDGSIIIDGRLRYAAYRKAGIKPCFTRWPVRPVSPGRRELTDDDDSIGAYVIAMNLTGRMHHTKDQKVMIGVELENVGPTAVMRKYGVVTS